MLPDRVSNSGTLTYESGALPIALRGPGLELGIYHSNVNGKTSAAPVIILNSVYCTFALESLALECLNSPFMT